MLPMRRVVDAIPRRLLARDATHVARRYKSSPSFRPVAPPTGLRGTVTAMATPAAWSEPDHIAAVAHGQAKTPQSYPPGRSAQKFGERNIIAPESPSHARQCPIATTQAANWSTGIREKLPAFGNSRRMDPGMAFCDSSHSTRVTRPRAEW